MLIIDGDAKPSLPNEKWEIKQHIKNGQVDADSVVFDLYLPQRRNWRKLFECETVYEEIEENRILNANFPQFFLEYPNRLTGLTEMVVKWQQVPWRVIFLGTIFLGRPSNAPCFGYKMAVVSCLRLVERKWISEYVSLRNLQWSEYLRVIILSDHSFQEQEPLEESYQIDSYGSIFVPPPRRPVFA